MSFRNQVASLEYIGEDINKVITACIHSFEDYSAKQSLLDKLTVAQSHLRRLESTFRFLEFKAAEQLVSDMRIASGRFPQTESEIRTKQIGALGYALTILSRYIDFITYKPSDIPELLFPYINSFRKVCGLTLFKESQFFKVDCDKPRADNELEPSDDVKDIARKSRRFRQMFQIGFIEVIKETNQASGFVMMQRALGRLDEQCGNPYAANLWWIAQAAIDGFLTGGLIINKMRLTLFRHLDLQIRNLDNMSSEVRQSEKDKAQELTTELLYLVSLSDADSPLSKQVQTHFDIASGQITDRVVYQESLLFKGPRHQDFADFYATLLEEISQMETILKTPYLTKKALSSLCASFERLSNLLKLLQMEEFAEQARGMADKITRTLNENEDLPKIVHQNILEELETIGAELLAISQAPLANKEALIRKHISPQHVELCIKAQKLLQQVSKMLDEFVEQEKNTAIVSKIPELLEQIIEILKQLDEEEYTEALVECADVLNNYFLKQPELIEVDLLQLMADVLCSVEFYLETKIHQQQPNPQILIFASEHLENLKDSY